LVKNGFTDAGAFRDLVHGGRVIPLRDEHFAGCTQ
jgi:hypothetical protein